MSFKQFSQDSGEVTELGEAAVSDALQRMTSVSKHRSSCNDFMPVLLVSILVK